MKKLIILSLFTLGATSLSYAQWDQTSPTTNTALTRQANITVKDLRFGVLFGTYNGNTDPYTIFSTPAQEDKELYFMANNSGDLSIRLYDGDLKIGSSTTPYTQFSNSANGTDSWIGGNLGIGTTTPLEKLHIDGGYIYMKDGIASGNSQDLNTGIRFANYHNDNYAELSAYRGINVNQTGFQFKTNAGGTLQETMTLTNGSVYVGDYDSFISGGGTNITGYKLQVEGKIRTEEVKIYAISGWSDFVFARDYHLRSLSEVQNFIVLNGHLPDVPSEQEVLAKGYELGTMDATLLQKIEELTLYTIDQQEQLEEQKALMAQQQEVLAKQQALIEQLLAERE